MKTVQNKAYKYRLYPNKKQEELFLKTFGCCRKIWNLMLADKENYFTETGKTLQTTPARYKLNYPYLKEVDSLALTNVQLDLEEAFRSFFDKTRKKRNGKPKYKSRKARNSYTTNNQNGTIAIIDEKHVKLPIIGKVKAVVHRQPEKNWKLKSATISRECDGSYYISVLFEFPKTVKKIEKSSNSIGLDYKSDGLYMDSNGKIGTNHKFFKESQDRLAKQQRKLSRKKGSKKSEEKSANYLKQLKKVNKLHRHIANQRLDNLHKLSTEIANQYDTVCVEDLNMKSLSNKGFKNGKATMDNGYGLFLRLLEYKLEERGKNLVKVDKWYPSSQICSNCGRQKKIPLSQKTYTCECGLKLNRDLNAAINIKKEGLRLLSL